MQIDINNIRSQIQAAKGKWESIAPSIAASNPALQDISNEFDQIKTMLDSLPEEVEINGVPWQIAINNLNALVQHAGSPNQAPTIPVWLWTFKSSLIDAVPAKYFSEDRKIRLDKNLESKITKIESNLSSAEKINRQLKDLEKKAKEIDENVSELSSSSKDEYDSINEIKLDASNALKSLKESSEEASNALSELQENFNYIEQAADKQKSLLKELDESRQEVNHLLKNANKVGLAKSFQDKKNNLESIWKFWALMFCFGISGLIVIGATEIFPLLSKESIDPVALALRVMISAPVVWFTWFSARQYSHILRLSEDYAFKEAAAMAFIGYRDEMGDDEGMLDLLREYAIRNFGTNPAELLMKKADASTPLHEMADKIFDNVKPSELAKMIIDKLKG